MARIIFQQSKKHSSAAYKLAKKVADKQVVEHWLWKLHLTERSDGRRNVLSLHYEMLMEWGVCVGGGGYYRE